MSTHIVYATYDRNYGKRKYANLEKTLYFSLKKTFSTPSDIAEVTVVKAFDRKPHHRPIEGYYNLHEFQDRVQYLEVENLFGSTGQWFTAYEKYRNTYDYYFFMEDDYTMSMPHFDKVTKEMYQSYFPDDIGVLCHLYLCDSTPPPHFNGFIFVSAKTMEKLFISIPNIFDVLQRLWDSYRKKIQARWQLIFSKLMRDVGIPHRGCCETHPLLFWHDKKRGKEIGQVHIFSRDSIRARKKHRYLTFNDCSLINGAIELPVQLVRKCFLVREEDKCQELLEKGVSFGLSAINLGRSTRSFHNPSFEKLDLNLASNIQREFPLDLEFAIYVGTKDSSRLEAILKRLLITPV